MPSVSELAAAWRRHWPHYAAEAAGLAFFVSCGALLAVVLQHPASPIRQALWDNDLLRRGLQGIGMGLVIVAIVYSPWGRRSGAHINPAVTLAFWQLGKMRPVDAIWYVLAQAIGGLAAAMLMRLLLAPWYGHPTVNYSLTLPVALPYGQRLAFGAEFIITFILMLVLLLALHSRRLKGLAGWLVGILIALYVWLETPYSGMSLNPARTVATAVAAGNYTGLWVYLLAPVLATWLATVLFLRLHHGQELSCAIVAGCAPAPRTPHSTEEPPQYPDEEG